MTEKRTLSLSARQWRVLLHDNLDILKAAVQQTETIDEDGLRKFSAQLDDMKMLAAAWYQVDKPKKLVVPQQLEVSAIPPQGQGNGAEPIKKRRGRPTNAEKAAQTQAVQ